VSGETSDSRPIRTTPLEAAHIAMGATLTDFAGWRLPLRFSGEIAEHRAVRASAGLFDISHMGQITMTGPDASSVLGASIVSDVAKLDIGRARYTMICNDQGGVLDDLIVYRLGENEMFVIANASNTAVVLSKLADGAVGSGVEVRDVTLDRALISLQGPFATSIIERWIGSEASLPSRFRIASMPVAGVQALVARTGYTGEDGVELSLAREDAEVVWRRLLEGDGRGPVLPIGLGARDSLRLEAGLPLYGHELDEDHTPFDAGFGRVVDLDHDFPGRDALRRRKDAETAPRLVGLVAEGKRSPRQGYRVLSPAGQEVGVVTSGGPSPTFDVPIAMAYVDASAATPGTAVEVDIRNRPERARIVALPFLTSVPRPAV
jgi:aminomethyltransferase